MEDDSTQEPHAETVDAVAEPGLVESFVGNYPTHYILGNDDEVGQRCSANFAMADSAELAKEGKLAEFAEQSFGDKLGDDEGDAGDGAAVEPRPAPTLAVGDVVRYKAWGEGLSPRPARPRSPSTSATGSAASPYRTPSSEAT